LNLNRITIEVVSRMRTVPAYIHIPQTGGTHIKQRETARNQSSGPSNSWDTSPLLMTRNTQTTSTIHKIRDLYPRSYDTILLKDLKKHFVFSTVRNSFAWLVS